MLQVTWAAWYNENEPEKYPSPIDSKFASEEEVVSLFNRLMLVRCVREDRTLLAVNDFIRKMEGADTPVGRIPVMGPRYVEPVTDTVDSVLREMEATTPVIYLLSAGADPTDSIETLARRKRRHVHMHTQNFVSYQKPKYKSCPSPQYIEYSK
jgi:dynein heavy chain